MRRLRSSGLRVLAVVLAIGLGGCATRTAGQVEVLSINSKSGALEWYGRAPAPKERKTFAQANEPIRSDHDIITLQIETAYIQNLPFRLTGSKDVIIFADVWENAAMAYNAPSLTSIVYIGTNQKVPGRFNVRDAIAYGPTAFKGHPLKIRFTMMVLQKDAADKQSSAIGVLGSFIEAAAPQYSVITSQAAKLLQNVLKAQPDIKFFDFEVTFTSDRPESLTDIVAKAQTETVTERSPDRAVASQSFTLGQSGSDEVHWLRYGRYALVETEPYDGQSPVAGLKPSDVRVEDGWLHGPSGRLPTSYIVFRLTCCQLAENNDVLRAAADANAKLVASLQRSPGETAAALAEIKASAEGLRDVVIRSKAETLASQAHREAQATGKSCTDALASFNRRWSNETKLVSDPEQKKRFGDIADSVRERWAAKCVTASAAPPAASAPWLDTTENRDALKENLKKEPVRVQSREFKVQRVVAVSKSDNSAGKPFDTVEVELSAVGSGDRVARADVEAKIAEMANDIVSNTGGDTAKPIKVVKITNQDADALKNVWKP
jgi:hypothetical protein